MKTEVVNMKFEQYDVFIGRPSKYGNPFKIGIDGNREEVVQKFRVWILTQPQLLESLEELRGKRLGCFCKRPGIDVVCHGDVIVEILENKEKTT